MKKVKVLWVLFLLAFIGCSAAQVIEQHPVKGSHYVARVTFNDALENYLIQRSTLTDEERMDIEIFFYEGSTALDLWGEAVDLKDATVADKQAAYNRIKMEIFRLLFRYGIFELEGGTQ